MTFIHSIHTYDGENVRLKDLLTKLRKRVNTEWRLYADPTDKPVATLLKAHKRSLRSPFRNIK